MKREKFEPNAAYLTFLSRLRLARMEAKISQRELARRIGAHHSRVVRSEAQPPQRALDIIEVRAICQALQISVVDFTRELEAALSESSTDTANIDASSPEDAPTAPQ